VSGYHVLFVLASCLYRVARKPYVVGSSAILYGFVKSYINRSPRVSNPQLITYIRSQQLRRLAGRPTIWK
jgi:biofilm PGA synthesis N-glycosyltransferase PgaC